MIWHLPLCIDYIEVSGNWSINNFNEMHRLFYFLLTSLVFFNCNEKDEIKYLQSTESSSMDLPFSEGVRVDEMI